MLYIKKVTSDSVIDFAAEELKKYLRMMMPDGGDVKISYAPDAEEGFRLGLMQNFGLDVSDADNAELDDVLYIDCDTSGGIVAGSNPRSVLIAVYEYLRQNGCRWLFPGVDGEYIPLSNIKPVKYRHKPSSRYRGNCIEGATGQKMLLDFIDFMPKLGLNTFQLQFKIPATFYDRNYQHFQPQNRNTPEPITLNCALQWSRALECEMSRRGIMLHSYGHGFTQDPFGLGTSTGWQTMEDEDIPDDKREFLAMLNGKRTFFKKSPLNTNVCMSNPKVRELIKTYIADYCASHSNVDYLHVWLADDFNNHCECDECVKKIPTDWYVMLLNEIDAELAARNLHSRIVFISYEETIWPPISERLNNPDRFTMMIAPITRDFTHTLAPGVVPVVTEYERNKILLPRDLGTYLEYFNEWKKAWQGTSFVFDYHFWMTFHYDISGLRLAKVTYDDNTLFRERGLNGTIECGTQRAFFPTGVVFYTHARYLFDENLSFDQIVNDYFSHAFGSDYEKFIDYLNELEGTLPYLYLSRIRRNITLNVPTVIEKLRRADVVLEKGRALVKSHYNSDERIQTVSVRILEYHLKYTARIIEMILKRIDGDEDGARLAYEKMLDEYASVEKEFEYHFDPCQTFGQIGRILVTKIEKDSDEKGEEVSVQN